MSSPYDVDARYARKYTTSWIGYKVHLTETCDDDLPHLITHVETTAGPIADGMVTEPVHRALRAKELLPRMHIVDTGYLDAELLVTTRRDFAVDLVGPTRKDLHWQARNRTGFAAADFQIDWEAKTAICPAGKQSVEWMPLVDNRKNDVIKLKFSTTDCAACLHRSQCTRSALPRRTLTIRPEQQYRALEAARQREAQEDFATEYARRAGVEGTLSQGVRVMHLRRSRYRGQKKTHLQHVLTAAAIDLVRLAGWLAGETPEKTRKSAFVRLMVAPTPN